jgi:hypothetical protein
MKCLFLALLFSAMTLSAADVTGKWAGSLQVKNSDGETQNPPAYLVLKQEGDKLTGTGGPAEDRQEATITGKVDGNKLIFVAEHEGRTMNFTLQLDGDSMKGELTRETHDGEKETAQLSLKRVSEPRR